MTDFVEKCFIKDPNERWTIPQLKGHPLFNDIESCKEGWVRDCANRTDRSSQD